MKLKAIKSAITHLKENETIDFFSAENGSYRIDRIFKNAENFECLSWGMCWSDQDWDEFTEKEIIAIIWEQKPHSFKIL